MNQLFSKYRLKNMELKNRIVMPPMCMFCASENGYVTDWHIEHYTARAAGGVGLIIVEATAVEPDGRISENDLGIWSDSHIKPLKELVDRVHSYGAKIGIQLAHAGRKSKIAINPLSVSEEPFSEEYKTPKKIDDSEIETIAKNFQDASKRALKAGFDFIEIHAAHGYLLNVFLSPLTNNRTDKWGGSIEKRFTFVELVTSKIKEVWPEEKPLGIRISAYDYKVSGISKQDIDYIAKKCIDLGIDIINVSSGGVVSVPIDAYPGYQIKLAEQVKNNNIPVMAGGLINSVELAMDIIENQRADLVYLGRALLRNPYWVVSNSYELVDKEFIQTQYVRAYR